MNHADSARDGIRRITDLHGVSVEQNLALIRASQSEEDIHERCLAGAVFAEERMDLSGLHIQIDSIVRYNTWVTFGDSAHFEPRRWGLCHAHGDSFVRVFFGRK